MDLSRSHLYPFFSGTRFSDFFVCLRSHVVKHVSMLWSQKGCDTHFLVWVTNPQQLTHKVTINDTVKVNKMWSSSMRGENKLHFSEKHPVSDPVAKANMEIHVNKSGTEIQRDLLVCCWIGWKPQIFSLTFAGLDDCSRQFK